MARPSDQGRQDPPRIYGPAGDAFRKRDLMLEHLMADRRSYLAGRIGSCTYGLRWRVGDNGDRRLHDEQAREWEED